MKKLVLGALLLAAPAQAYQLTDANWTWQVSAVEEPWRLNMTDFPSYMGTSATIGNRLQVSMDRWTNSGAAVAYSYGGVTSVPGMMYDDTHVVSFSPTDNPNNALGLNAAWSYNDGLALECDIVFFGADAQGPIIWSLDPTDPIPGYFDFETVATHEFGHCAGLGHSNTDTVMQPTMQPGEMLRELTPDDLAGIDAVYGAICDDLDGDGWARDVRCTTMPGPDCDDLDVDTNPDGVEVCDARDNDCDGLTDSADGDLIGATLWGSDVDGDGWGSDVNPASDCSWPGPGWVNLSLGVDCDDLDASVNPSAVEACDGVDSNCDGALGDEADLDGDGWIACAECDDGNASVQPGANEICDGVDNDCNGLVDSADPNSTGTGLWYLDADGDGFGVPPISTQCTPPANHVGVTGDCNDADPALHPDADEVCDGADNDRDFLVDDFDTDLLGSNSWYRDNDGDGYGGGEAEVDCDQPTGSIADNSDCDDSDNAVFPGATEVCDGVDNDCDGSYGEG